VDAKTVVEQEVRELVRRRGLDPVGEPTTVRELVDTVVSECDGVIDSDLISQQVYDAVAGFGPLQQYLDDGGIEEIWINAPARVVYA